MVISKYFVFIHLHKCGGNFVLKGLFDYLPGVTRIGYHYPRAMLPGKYANLPVLGFVRNPWDWYASWYCFNANGRGMNPLYRALTEDGCEGFKPVVTRLVNLGQPESAEYRGRLIRMLPDSIVGNRGVGLAKSDIVAFPGGFFSWQFNRMFGLGGKYDDVIFGKLENLREDYLHMLNSLNVPVSSELSAYINTAPPVNTSQRENYRQYYDSELKELVFERDNEIIKRFGYEF